MIPTLPAASNAPPTLPSGWTVQVDGLDATAWHGVLDQFADANVYQSWPYESVLSGATRMSHLLVLHHGVPLAAAQVRISKLPLVRLGEAYVRWGPMWQRRDRAPDPQALTVALDCMRHEYATRRGLAVRVLPYLLDDDRCPAVGPLLAAHGFRPSTDQPPQRTLVMDLEAPLAELRAGFDQKWRNCLNRAEKNSLCVEEGTDDALFEQFLGIHQQMLDRKQFRPGSDVRAFRRMQGALPEAHRMRVFLASSAGSPAAGIVCSRIGDFGVFLHGATSDSGMTSNASYLLQWRVVRWLRQAGACRYNLHGINPATNPGTYRFKVGLCGRNGRDLHYLGAHACDSAWPNRLAVDLAHRCRQAYRRRLSSVAQLHPGTSP